MGDGIRMHHHFIALDKSLGVIEFLVGARYYGGAKHPNICRYADHQTSGKGAKHRNMISAGKTYYGASHLSWNLACRLQISRCFAPFTARLIF